MKAYLELFHNLKREYERGVAREADLICKEGFYGGCPVLKLQKAAWTNDSMLNVPNKSGIFFSLWLDEAGLAKNRAHYNIHALKLRHLNGYSITSKDFASDFRKAFAPLSDSWPNVSVDFGPLTLMQGWIEIDAKQFQRDALDLMKRFGAVSRIIDGLLAVRRAKPKRD